MSYPHRKREVEDSFLIPLIPEKYLLHNNSKFTYNTYTI